MNENGKSKGKLIIMIFIIVILVVILINNVRKPKEEEPTFETEVIETQTLTTTINSSGKITAENSKNVTSQLMNYKVTNVKVKVGDKVNVGDVLCTFDTSALAKTVNDLAATINATNTTGQITVASAERALQDVQRSRDNSLNELNKTVQNLKQDYENNESALNTAKSDLQTKQVEVNNIKAQINTLTADVNNAKAQRDTVSSLYTQKENEYNKLKSISDAKQVALDAAKADPNQLSIVAGLETDLAAAIQTTRIAETAKNVAKNELTVKENALTGAQAKLNEAVGKVNTINTEITKLNQYVSGQQTMVNAKRDAYVSAQHSYDNQSSTLNNQVANAQGQLDSAKAQTSVSSLTTQEQLDAYRKQLEETNLKSTVSGIVTAVSAKAGDYYTGGTLFVIEGVESFIVETEIDEYDIADIKVGMEAIIKTDATREEQLSGEVISVAPAATGSTSAATATGMSAASSMSSSGSNATYTVKVAINTENDRLRLGMNAKLNIITKKSENALTVPYDAVIKKEDGSKVVIVIENGDIEKEIPVITGLESGYYTEISSSELKEGMKVKVPKVDDTSTFEEILNSMGATAGM